MNTHIDLRWYNYSIIELLYLIVSCLLWHLEKLKLKNVIRRFDASHIIIKSKKC